MNLGSYIATERQKLGLKQSELARKINISRMHLWGIENNRTGMSYEVAERLSWYIPPPRYNAACPVCGSCGKTPWASFLEKSI